MCAGQYSSRVSLICYSTLGRKSTAIMKELPVLQCEHCSEYVLVDDLMGRLANRLGKADQQEELEILHDAA